MPMKYHIIWPLFCFALGLIFSIATFAEPTTSKLVKKSIDKNSPMNLQTYPGLIIEEDDNKLNIKTLRSDGKAIVYTWEVTSSLFHTFITNEDCLKVDAELCSDLRNERRFHAVCTYPCLFGAPHLVLTDPSSKKIYIYNQLGIGGNVGGSVMLFVLDPVLRSIRKLALSDTDPDDAKLSPLGATLALAFSGYSPTVQFIHVQDGETFDVKILKLSAFNAISDVDKTPVIFLDQIHWLSENRLQLRERIYPNKWSTEKTPLSISLKTIQIDIGKKTGHVLEI
jgi:hypothetical protein